MAETSKIEWTDATFNPWIGCTKVSPGCDHCYAEQQDRHRGWTPEGWGGPRRRTSAEYWKQPLKWDRDAARQGERRRVFCSSLADVFDNQVDASWRTDLWNLIAATPHLDWLLLTKRPQNIKKMLPENWGDGYPNVWLGTTVENQAEADRRIPHLLAVQAMVRFLSCEPLLGPMDLQCYLARCQGARVGECITPSCPQIRDNEPSKTGRRCPLANWRDYDEREMLPRLDWVIVGGESGKGARPMHPDWARSLRDQCAAAGVPFFFKQWGEWAPYDRGRFTFGHTDEPIQKFGKKLAGRLLDGALHDGWPG